MGPETVVELLRGGLFITVVLVSTIIGPGLVVGLLISIFQAATQINEQTLSFLPRLLITLVTLMLAGPWMLNRLLEFTYKIILDIPLLIG